MQVGGVILCGGESKHMGRPKAWLPRIAGYVHPLEAVYRIEVVETAERLLHEGRLRTGLLFEAVPKRIVEAAELVEVDPTFQTLRNVNTMEDYEKALVNLNQH